MILNLRWAQVDPQAGVLNRLAAGAAPDEKKRAPKVKLGRRILAHLRRWRRLDGAIEYVCHYDSGPVTDSHTSWRKAVKRGGLHGVTRHTRATWLMQKGVPIWQAAGHLGMTTKTLEAVYGHHAPDWQEDAANV